MSCLNSQVMAALLITSGFTPAEPVATAGPQERAPDPLLNIRLRYIIHASMIECEARLLSKNDSF